MRAKNTLALAEAMSVADYRAALLVHHNPGPGGGYFAGIEGSGAVVIGDFLRFIEEFGTAPGPSLSPLRDTSACP